MSYRILEGHVIDLLRTLPANSVQCVVTSPPCWGLRDYRTPAQVWGGRHDCEHRWGHESLVGGPRGAQGASGQRVNRRNIGEQSARGRSQGCWCQACGAWRGSLGLEPNVDLYLVHIVQVFGEVRRVLREDATLWLNLGDSYVAHPHGRGSSTDAKYPRGRDRSEGNLANLKTTVVEGPKSKDLVMMPARVALALQSEGWYLRADIVWHKTNPMPESVKDRPTKSHEYLFLLTKSERFFYDADAIKEPASPDTHARYSRGRGDAHKWADGGPGNQTIATNKPESLFGRTPAGWHQGARAMGSAPRDRRSPGVNPKCAEPGIGIKQNSSFSAAVKERVEWRNKRSVWALSTQAFKGAHFATFPEKLVEPCVLAGCPLGGTVLDPFAGSGTVGVVALRHGREFVGIELNSEYCEMARSRIEASLSIRGASLQPQPQEASA